MPLAEKVGIIVIGRNEGERLRRCLQSVCDVEVVVYVDSGSSDGSVQVAREAGALVAELSSELPFTAARARNTGFRELCALSPSAKYVQFVDGDCEMSARWIEEAVAYMDNNVHVAIVCGTLMERNVEASVYNRLCAMEWKGIAGPVQSCGGIFMVRSQAFDAVSGFDETMIAGEEPELCRRLVGLGWMIHRLDRQMATHDAAMTRFRQWWQRAVRGGYGYAMLSHRFRRDADRPWRREVNRNWGWGLLLPLAVAVTALPTSGMSAVLLVLYPIWIGRIAVRRMKTYKENCVDAFLYALFCMLAKVAGVFGSVKYWWRRWNRVQEVLIEYK